MKDTWIVHPNRFDQTSDPRPTDTAAPRTAPRRTKTRRPDMTAPCILILPLPDRYGQARTKTGEIVFTATTWQSLAGSALLLAKTITPDTPRFGIKFPWEPQHQWWDGTRTDDDVLDRPDAAHRLLPWLQMIFPDATGTIETIDNRQR